MDIENIVLNLPFLFVELFISVNFSKVSFIFNDLSYPVNDFRLGMVL